jgi:hypothetical protein
MTVAELIEMLGRCPPGNIVVLAYDSLVCRCTVDESCCFILPNLDAEGCDPAVYLCAMDDESVAYHMAEEGGFPIPKADQKEKSE